MDNLSTWDDIKNSLMSPEDKAECAKWLDELGKLMNEFDAGKITEYEYRKLCFELDKKFGIADDADEDFYLTDDYDGIDEEDDEDFQANVDDANNFINPIAVHF